MYDMYPWSGAPTASTASTPSVPEAPKTPKAPKTATVPLATSAVQIALDRRDHGGDAAAEPAAALARQ
ncbi:MAG: hypothetical protein ACRDOU_15215 [Streptosporangiaceae bacterium]